MLEILRLVLTPLISLAIFTLGNGFFTTLLVLRMHAENASSFSIGAMSAAYYLGLVIGSFYIEKLIIKVGHIRSFSGFASALAVISLLHGFFYNIPCWLVLRFLSGYATAGIFIVIESWLLLAGNVKVRGQILSLYMISFYAAQACGQFFLNISPSTNLLLFAISAMLCSLSVIPLSMVKIGQPQISEPSVLNFKKLYQASASGVIGCICCGLILSAIYGLLPLFIIERLHSTIYVSGFMAAVIFGGMALQYPLGKLSDHMDRRTVLIGVSMSFVLISSVTLLTFNNTWMSFVCMFLFGGMAFTLYPISISHACDALSSKDMVSGTQGLMLAYSLGATAGPLIAPLLMKPFGPAGLFFYFIAISFMLAAFFVWRRLSTPRTLPDEPFQTIPQTSPIAAELDPRG